MNPNATGSVPAPASRPHLNLLLFRQPGMHRSHDYKGLMRRWKTIAKSNGLKLTAFAEADGYPVYEITNPKAGPPTLYLSAGIHGDEPGATEGLCLWAGRPESKLCELPMRIFPCLNPWGLVENRRHNAAGVDLNRIFAHDSAPPHIVELCERIEGDCYDLALALHEDYDGEGLYVYEISRRNERPSLGERILKKAALEMPNIPLDLRKTIDKRRVTATGLIRRRLRREQFPELPEALHLHLQHSERTFTFETPSEFDIRSRAEAQAWFIQAALKLQGAFPKS